MKVLPKISGDISGFGRGGTRPYQRWARHVFRQSLERVPVPWAWGLCLIQLLFCATFAQAAEGSADTRPEYFKQSLRPLLQEYCLKCHSTEKKKGDLDLERFSSLEEVKKHPKVWERVVEQVGGNEMPPKDKPQPSAPQRQQLLAWAEAVLNEIALARAGDPGPVVLRRLSNAEYTFTVRDLTGVDSLNPAREFPAGGAAGEGFMNVGNALVMSPALLSKYLEAGKEIASHAVLLPQGIRFSAKTTRPDCTEEILAQIRAFYSEFTDPRGGDKVNLQGIVFEPNGGGRLPLEKYLAATLELRDAPRDDRRRLETLARERGLSPKYLRSLLELFESRQPSLLLEPIRARWRQAKPDEAAALAGEIAPWQKALWKFSSVGHIGKLGGPKAWMEPVNPLTTRQDVRFKLSPKSETGEVTVYLVAGDAGDGNENDFVIWQQPRLVAPGRVNLLLRDVPQVARALARRRDRLFASTAKSLAAAAEAGRTQGQVDMAALARAHGLETDLLGAWFDYLGINSSATVKIDSYFTNTVQRFSGYDFVNGWGSLATPSLAANSSDQHVRIPGNMKPHSVAVHPSPTLQAAVGWRSPVAAKLRVAATIQHAHPECGNGVTWALELRRGATRQALTNGTAAGAKEATIAPIENLAVEPGDLISLLIGPRDGNHSCDLTAIDLVLTSDGEGGREWNLAKDVSGDVLAGNPHADRWGTAGVWHFYTEPDKGGSQPGPRIPPGSLLARWQLAPSMEEKQKLAGDVQQLLQSGLPAGKDSPDLKLYQELASLGGPLFAGAIAKAATDGPGATAAQDDPSAGSTNAWALDPAQFGKGANGRAIDPASLSVRAPSVIEIRLPPDLVTGCELVTTGVLDPEAGADGSVQLQVLKTKPAGASGLVASAARAQGGKKTWTDGEKPAIYDTPIVVNEGSAARQRIETELDQFRQIFPAALCYAKIVPVDEVVTLTLYYREDHQLARLMLDDRQRATLDRLWDELHFVSHDALTQVDVYDQLWQFATQDADPKVFEPLRDPIRQRAAAFRQLLTNAQPSQLEAVLEFAERAYRRPLVESEKTELRALYARLRGQDLPHDEAIRLTLARTLVAPAFLYRLEKPGPGAVAGPVDSWELATRLSYFLWSSAPDAELRAAAAAGTLRNPDTLVTETRRMLRDPRMRRMAVEFACAWLDIYAFDELGEKSERHFPTFNRLRGAMYEESIRFFTDLWQRDGSVLDLLNADHTFLNEALAKHYGISGVKFENAEEWKRVDEVKKFSRGGILGLATTLAKHSGASRTSPILRGNWVTEVLLGEKVPRPPKDVPRLPEDEAAETLTVRQLTEKHSQDPRCAGCHLRMDAYGYSLEGFDAIGRRRERDLGDRPIDTHVQVMDGAQFDGLGGLRDYLLTKRRDAFVKQFCRKLLGYSLGRAVQLSDGPLLTEMRAQLQANDYRVSSAVATIVRSHQFREIRGLEMTYEE